MKKRFLITGIAGGLARLVAEKLVGRGDEVVGVDYRETKHPSQALEGVLVYRANYNKTAIEDVFARHAPTHVLHLGRVGNLKESAGKRFDLNVVGSQKILNLALEHEVSRLVVLSTFHIYGADPANHIPITEDEPLRAGLEFPQLADAIQLDNMASTWVWRYPQVSTAVLRPCNVVGPMLRNTMSELLREPRIPRLFGFDPMLQFLYEDDLASAIIAAADGDSRGIFNVAGRGAIPWSTAVELTQAKSVVVPSSMVSLVLKLFSALPDYLVNFFKYPCVVGDQTFRDAFGWQPQTSLRDTIEKTLR
jgi:UDP-glucose 4-epimerase